MLLAHYVKRAFYQILNFIQDKLYIKDIPLDELWRMVLTEFSLDDQWNLFDILNTEKTSLLFSMYNTFYNSTHTIPDQRLKTHAVFLTTNTIFLGMLGFAASNYHKIWINWTIQYRISTLVIPCLFIIWLCCVWYSSLKKYDFLNTILILITKAIEQKLPTKPVTYTFSILSKTKGNYNLGASMRMLPTTFIILYFCAFFYIFIK
jgi:hypothetical protein